MDTLTTRSAGAVGGHRHHQAQGFCTVCGTAWPCWRGLRDAPGFDADRRSGPTFVAAAGRWPY